jgi:hypothetical protein
MIEANNFQIRMDQECRVDSLATDLSHGIGKVATGFVKDVLLGMELAHSPRLSDIARALEEKIGLRATHKRLSRNAARSELAPVISNNLLQLAASRVHDDTLLILDWPNLLKNRAEKMENLNVITDTKGNRVGRGYHLAEVVAAEVGSDNITPLAQSIWPEINPETDFLSHTVELVARVRKACGGSKGIIVADRSADHMGLLGPWTEDSNNRYLVRLRGRTELMFRRQIVTASELADRCDTPYGKNVVNIGPQGPKPGFLHFGYKSVRLPVAPDRPLSLVVVRGVSPEPVMLLTTEHVRDNRAILTELVEAYCRRWRIMSTKLRFYERHQLSRIRVLGFDRICNLAILEFALVYLHALQHEAGGDVRAFDDIQVVQEGIDLYRAARTEIPRLL